MPRATRSLLVLAALICMPACSFFVEKPPPPPPLEYTLTSPYRRVHTIAIAPAINYSGSHDFDVLTVSDSLFSEMQQVQGLNVLPLNKTLIAMRQMGMHSIDSVEAAQHLASALGADGLVIPAITAYDPYNPPVVGMTLQMFTPPPAGDAPASPHEPVSQVNAVFNASNQTVLHELRAFADGRADYSSALQDGRFIMDSDSYMRFVCHAMIRRLLEVESRRLDDR